MATLTDDEINIIRSELLDNVLDVDASPYFGYTSIYNVIRDNVSSSSVAATTSATTVASVGATTITVASAAGLTASMRVQIDVDGSREIVTIRNVSGLTLSVICKKLHSGTYPVEVISGLTTVRGILSDLSSLREVNSLDALGSLGLKRVDEVEFKDGIDVAQAVAAQRDRWRKDLAGVIGLGQVYREMLARASGGSDMGVY